METESEQTDFEFLATSFDSSRLWIGAKSEQKKNIM